MGTISLVTLPDNTALVTLTEFKNELGISGSGSDGVLQALIEQASSRVEGMLGRPILRAQYRETLEGSGKSRLVLGMRPVISLDAISYQGSTQVLADFEIDNRDAGFLYRTLGVFACPDDPNAWSVTTTAGWFVGDDDKAVNISVAASDDSYNSAALFPTHLKPEDLFVASGFTAAANNGLRKVVTATTSKITVANALADETSATRTLRFANLPGAIKRAVTMLARDGYVSRASGGTIVEEAISGATTLRWLAPGSGGAATIEQSVSAVLFPLMDF